jgi:hypothetical protein
MEQHTQVQPLRVDDDELAGFKALRISLIAYKASFALT